MLFHYIFQTNVILLVNVETGEISRITCSTLPQTVQEKRRFPAVGATKSVSTALASPSTITCLYDVYPFIPLSYSKTEI